MKEYRTTIDKISADEELKQKTINKLTAIRNETVKKSGASKSAGIRILLPRVAIAAVTAAVLILSAVFFPLPKESISGLPEGVYSAGRQKIIDEIASPTNMGNVTRGDAGEGYENDSAAAVPDHATTNVQTEGVDEGDIIKTDNDYIYMLSSSGLTIVSVKDEMQVAVKKNYENFVPAELLVYGGRLIVIGGTYDRFVYHGSAAIGSVIEYGLTSCQKTRVLIYEIKNTAELVLVKDYNISGYFLTSRLIGSKLIIVTNYYFDIRAYDTYFPLINGREISTDSIYLYSIRRYCNYIITVSYDLDSAATVFAAHLGLYGGVYYVSKENFYFFNTDYSSTSTLTDGIWQQTGVYKTLIYKISLSTLKCTAAGAIDGVVGDRYWVDEYEGDLRVVSWCYLYANNTDLSYTNVSVLDNDLNYLGKITGIAVSERIYSVRMNKTEGSLVTFRQVDPLFKLDFSDRKNPKISNGLKENGVNTYLQYLGGNALLGLGRSASDSGVMLGLKVALYDNSGDEAANVKTVVLGNRNTYSPALSDPKAILNDTAKGMFSFPFTTPDNSDAYKISQQGLAVFEYDLSQPDDDDKLALKGVLSNVGDNVRYNTWFDYYDAYHSYILRGARIGSKIYTISEEYVTSYDLDTLDLVQRLKIAEFKPAIELFGICYLGHDWGEWTTSSHSTCLTGGTLTRVCKNNPTHTQTQQTAAIGHKWGEWTVKTPSSGTSDGEEIRTCLNDPTHSETRIALRVSGLVLVSANNNTEYEVIGYNGTVANIVIPASVNGKPVTAIADEAFARYSNGTADNLNSVKFESGSNIKRIGVSAFFNRVSLTAIEFPKSLISIDYNAFGDCKGLKSALFPADSQLSTIGSYAFSNCEVLTSIKIPAGVKDLNSVFYACGKLESVTFASGSLLETLDFTFRACRSLKSIIVPASVTHIGGNSFGVCENLESITFASSSKLKSIGWEAFFYCENLTAINIPQGVTNIDSSAFKGCRKLSSVTVDSGNLTYKSDGNCIIQKSTNSVITGCADSIIPDYAASIASYAFAGRKDLVSITIPESVENIAQGAFQDCPALLSIVIPASVTGIGSGAFSSCTSLATVSFAAGSRLKVLESSLFMGCRKLESVNIPSSVTSIYQYAFWSCNSLKSIVLPTCVTNIGSYAFSSCTELESIEIPAGVQIGSHAFSGWTASQIIRLKEFLTPEEAYSVLGTAWKTGCNALIICG